MSPLILLADGIHRLLTFRSIDPLYGAFLSEMLHRSSYEEEILAIESVLEVPPTIVRCVRVPEGIAPGPLQTQILEPLLVQSGILIARVNATAGEGESEPAAGGQARAPGEASPAQPRFTLVRDDEDDPTEEDREPRPPSFPELLQLAFGTRLAAPEPIFVQPKWIAGGVAEFGGDFYRFVRSRDLVKQEGLILRHLLRLVILAGEFLTLSGDPDYTRIAEAATAVCQRVEPQYTKHYLEQAEAARKLDSV